MEARRREALAAGGEQDEEGLRLGKGLRQCVTTAA